jgi:hypothetical protein
MTRLQQGFTTGGIGSDRHFAGQQLSGPNVRFGSKADIDVGPLNVRFTLKSGHRNWPHYESAQHQVRQLRHVGRDPPRLVAGVAADRR